MKAGVEAAEAGAHATLGIAPDCPHTGYGYNETDRSIDPFSMFGNAWRVDPRGSRGGGFYWNDGILLFRDGVLIDLMDQHAPEILVACRVRRAAPNDLIILFSALQLRMRLVTIFLKSKCAQGPVL